MFSTPMYLFFKLYFKTQQGGDTLLPYTFLKLLMCPRNKLF